MNSPLTNRNSLFLILSAIALSLWVGWLFNSYLKSNLFQKITYLGEFALLIVFITLSFGLGSKILGLLTFEIHHPSIFGLFALTIGFGSLSLLTLGLGLLNLLYMEVAYLLVFLISLVIAPEIVKFLKHIQHSAFSNQHSAFLLLLLPAVLFNLAGALAPPTFFDDLVAHLGHPKTFVLEHRFAFYPYQVYTHYPLNMEMLYTFGFLLLQSDIFPKLLNFMMGIFVTLTLFLLADHFLDRKTAILSAIVFYFTPSVGILSTFATHDLTLTFFQLLSIYALLLWLETRSTNPDSRNHYLILSSLFCGLAMGTKYTGLYFFATMVLFLLMKSFRHSPFTIHHSLLFIFFALLPASPWFLKNLINTGNPVYPAFASIFGVKPFQKAVPGILSKTAFHSPLDFFLLPYHMTIYPDRFGSASPIGPLYLTILPITFFLRRLPQTVKDFLILSGILCLFWSLTLANTRYFLTGIALLAIVTAYLLIRLMEENRLLRLLSILLLSFSLLLNLFQTISVVTYLFNPLPVSLGLVSKEIFLKERLDYYPVVAYANQTLSQDSKILFLGETRTYYCERKTLSNSAYDKTILLEMIRSNYRTPHSALRTSESPSLKNLLSQLKEEGVTHVLYNEREAGYLAENFSYFNWKDPLEKDIYDSFTRNHLKTLYSENGVFLLEIIY